jgi:hypothetical protein
VRAGEPAAGLEQACPFGVAVPACRQVQGEAAAAVPGDAGGDVDQAGADGGAAGSGVAAEARHPAARVRLCAMEARVSQAALAVNDPDGRWGHRAACPVCEDLLDDGVVAALFLGLGRTNGHGVVAPGGE